MVTTDSGRLHKLWAELCDPTEERAFRHDTWRHDRARGVLVTGLAALIYLAGFWIDWGLPPAQGRIVTTGRVLGVLASLGVLWAARHPTPTRAWERSQLFFALLASTVVAYERLAWAGADPLPGGFVTIFIGSIVALLGFLPLSVRWMLPLAAYLIALPIGGLVVTGTPTVSIFIGGQMLFGAAAGMLIFGILLQRERRKTWHAKQSLQAAHDHIHALLEANLGAMEVLRLQAETDPLTGALNRRGGEALAATLLARGEPVSVLLIDVDHFKGVNDTYGHSGGDAALRHVVHQMRAASRVQDLVIRWGGDELLLVLADPEQRGGREVAHRLAQLARTTPVAFEAHRFVVTLSVGCATGTGTLASLIEAADAAVYVAKDRGRDRAVHAADIRLSA